MHKITRHIAIIVLLTLLGAGASGCWLANMPVYVPPYVPPAQVIEDPPVNIIEQAPEDSDPVPGRFTIRYEPADTLNPLLALNRDNIGITSLIYESLFVLDDRLRAVPLLCESVESSDYITFTLTILPNIMMHDGSVLTADDVTYSLRQARQRGRHRNKLDCIASVTSNGELTVTITLKSENVRFTRLLDVPIIKADSIDSELPPGTGPYIFPHPNNLLLTPFTGHRDYSNMPLSAIYLQVLDSDSELTELFDRGSLSLLWEDPASSFEIRINRDYDAIHYNTTALQFLGFNAASDVLRNSDVRRAIGCVIDRQYVVDEIMNTRPLQTIAAPVAISPIFNMYDTEWERRTQDPLVEMAALLERAGIEDFNADGYLEISDVTGTNARDFTLRFLVNIENSYKVAATEHIAAGLQQVGFNIDVRALPWRDFISALDKGEFEIYYGEVQLGADFDFSPLLLPDSSLNYGKTAHVIYEDSISNFLAAETQDEVSIAGKQLCDEIRINAPFIPILYKRHAIYTPLGVVTDASPTQSGVFYNFKNWNIDLDMLT